MPTVAQQRLVLPWDFHASFPVPLESAVEQGTFDAADCLPAHLAAIHDEHARKALATLADIDRVSAARRADVDSLTGKRPRTASHRAALPARLTATLERLRQGFDCLIDVYAEAFGDDAASAFRWALVAWHAGVEVVRDETSRVDRACVDVLTLNADGFPLAKPLWHAVARGRFGVEDNRPIDPSPDEVAEITRGVAQALFEHLIAWPSCRDGKEHPLLTRYREDFGTAPASALEAHARQDAACELAADRRTRRK